MSGGVNNLHGLLSSLATTILVLTMFVSPSSQRRLTVDENGVKTETFLSPKVEHVPGTVSNKYFYDIGFPKGHIAVKRFDAEVVDEDGNSVPLYEAYVHHWAVRRYYKPLGVTSNDNDTSAYVLATNAGVCDSLPQYFGLGAETRRTDTHVPDPYGIEVGNAPEGYEDAWLLNLHTIDTRDTVDKLRCLECNCELNNITVDGFGEPIGDVYNGGIRCCFDGVRCRLKDGYNNGVKKVYYMKYTVTYVDWNPSNIPVKIYILDVADTLEWRESVQRHHCWIEYEVKSCSADVANDKCIDTKSVSVSLASGGDVIYAVAHQHIGGIGSTLYGQDGRTLCSSFPVYGEGKEPGNEAGYIVGMSACYPQPGSVKFADGETLTIVSNYNNIQGHTGVMGMFYILVAEPLQKSNSILHAQNETGETVNNPTDAL